MHGVDAGAKRRQNLGIVVDSPVLAPNSDWRLVSLRT